MNNKQLNEHLKAIKYELSYAENKHPKFCDCFDSDTTILNYRKTKEFLVKNAQASNDKLTQEEKLGAIDILYEEFHEVCLAYAEGDLPHCLQELAQCGAVILRTMDFVKKEMEKKNEVR